MTVVNRAERKLVGFDILPFIFLQNVITVTRPTQRAGVEALFKIIFIY